MMARGSKYENWRDRLLVQHVEQFSRPSVTRRVPAIKVRTVAHVRIDLVDSQDAAPVVTDEPSLVADDDDLTLTASHRICTDRGELWLEGNSLLCKCPACLAPMTVRIWLELADCWRCRSSIALSQEQVRQAKMLYADAREAIPKVVRHRRSLPALEPALQATSPAAEPAVTLPDARHQELDRLTEQSVLASFVRRGFRLTPAWVVSFILHLIAILILALIVIGGDKKLRESIVLSTTVDSIREPGGVFRIEDPLDQLQDDLPLANELAKADRELRDVLLKANQDARELIVDPHPVAPRVDINELRKNVTTRPAQRMSFDARDPRVRAEIVSREGGTMMTEAAVARGLRWLASVQNRDGSWSLRDYRTHDRPNNPGDAMGTSLALLPFLGAGQTQESGIYKQTVAKGLAWLIEHQQDDGDLRAGYDGQAGMYAHGQASIVLCEALAMTGDEQLRQPAQRAIRFIENAQHDEGGWRYQPGDAGDTSVFGWQVMALQSARAPRLGLEVDAATLKLADYFLDLVAANGRAAARENCPEGALYCYQRGSGHSAAMTAEAILCRMYLGWKRDDPRLIAAVNWLVDENLPDQDEKNIYYWYYGTQVMHHFGGEPWETWNSRMRELLIGSQESRGRYPGSWDPSGFRWGAQGGRVYTTALSVCTLEVYYRHLPLFKQIKLDD